MQKNQLTHYRQASAAGNLRDNENRTVRTFFREWSRARLREWTDEHANGRGNSVWAGFDLRVGTWTGKSV
jgi:hypothetical protein